MDERGFVEEEKEWGEGEDEEGGSSGESLLVMRPCCCYVLRS